MPVQQTGGSRQGGVGQRGGHLLFLPMMPPRMQRGMVTRAQMTKITTMVPKGKACVDCSNTCKGSTSPQVAKLAHTKPGIA